MSNTALAALEQAHVEHSVIEQAQASLEFTQDLERAIHLCGVALEHSSVHTTLEVMGYFDLVLARHGGPNWHERPEAVALLS